MDTAVFPQLKALPMPQLLDQAVRVYRRNFVKLIGIIALVQVPISLLKILIAVAGMGISYLMGESSEAASLSYLGSQANNMALTLASLILVQSVAVSALVRAIGDSQLGIQDTILGTYRRTGGAWYRLLGAMLLLGILSIGVFIWLLVPVVGWLTGPGMLVFIGSVIFPLLAPVVVLEEKSGGQAIRRAWDLARSHFWWMLGFVLILGLFGQTIVTGPSTLLAAAWGALGGESGDRSQMLMLNTIIQALAALLSSLLFLPLFVSAPTLAYLQLRVKFEGLDLWLQTGPLLGKTPETVSSAPPASKDEINTGKEIGYFALISVGAVLIYAILFALLFGLTFGLMAAMGNF